MKLIYLASPYSHDDPKVREERAAAVSKYAKTLLERGYYVFCPISHSHSIDPGNRLGANTWLQTDKAILRYCQEIHIYMLDGWKDSKGVNEELQLARGLGLPVIYHDPQIQK